MLGVAAILQESANYALGVSNTLKTQVYDALKHLAQGFLDYTPNDLQSDPSNLKQIYDASLIVLYRALFILYAEARELLPVYESVQYRQSYSLKSIKEQVALDLDSGKSLLSNSATLWPRLKTLFDIINKGSPPLTVATFNGGLFDPEKHSFLEKFTVGDAHLQQAIDKMTRVDGQFVDYRDLAVRHLGTIYEGLLEYHLEPLATGSKDGWSVDLLNDKGERKATGSYYTPDYIVKYIVEQTLGPVLESNVTGLEEDAAKVEAVLATNVLDPAMGSGHFLVEATEYIARYLVEMGMHPEGSTNDETELAYWKRRVVQSCIYGIDLNPLAVELAKLSLWLATVAKDRPLSFLDHHLRAGDALVGARLDDLRLDSRPAKSRKKPGKKEQEAVEAGQLSMLSDDAFLQAMSNAVGSMWQIEENPGLTVAQVKEQEQAYSQFREQLTRKYGRLADLVTAQHFGLKVEVTSEQWQALADFATGRTVAALPQFVKWIEEADAIAEQRRFLHWELEFPEVFFSRDGQPLGEDAGFDAIVGNPPYVSAPAMVMKMPESRHYLTSKEPLLVMKWDLYCGFLASEWRLLVKDGHLGIIIPNQFLYQDYAEPLRTLFATEAQLNSIMDLGNTVVFEDAAVMTCIVCLGKRKSEHTSLVTAGISSDRHLSNLDSITRYPVPQALFLELPSHIYRLTLSDDAYTVIKRIMSISHHLGRICYGSVGVVPHSEKLNKPKEAFIFQAKVNAKCKKYIEGKNVSRYLLTWDGRWLEYDYDLVRRPSLPELLETEKVALKIVAGKTGLNAVYDSEGYYTDHSFVLFARKSQLEGVTRRNLHFVLEDIELSRQYDLRAILSLMNSRLLGWIFATYLTSDLNIGPDDAKRLPIRRFNFTTPSSLRQTIAKQGRELYECGAKDQQHEGILSFVEHHLSHETEEADVVHDLLAYLAEQMIDLNKQRQVAVEAFVLDLEGVLLSHADLPKLARLYTPPAKGKQPSQAAQDVLGPLAKQRLELTHDIGKVSKEQWKWLLKGRLKKIANLANLVEVYRNRQPEIAELDHKIVFTDDLIDQVVYRLYGLTEEEVAIVAKM